MNTIIFKNDKQLQKAFGHIGTQNFSSYIKKISVLIRDNILDEQNLNKALNEYNIKRITEIKEEILDMLLAYINFILSDNFITDIEAQNFKQLKRFFGVKEGDFYKHRYKEIENILDRQFKLIYSDNKIDTDEALHKVGLQELFDLGYDQFLQLINKEVRAALERGADPGELDTIFIAAYQGEKISSQWKRLFSKLGLKKLRNK